MARGLGARLLAGDPPGAVRWNHSRNHGWTESQPRSPLCPTAALQAGGVVWGCCRQLACPPRQEPFAPPIWVRTALPCCGLRAKPDLLGSPKQVAAQSDWQEEPPFLGQHLQLRVCFLCGHLDPVGPWKGSLWTCRELAIGSRLQTHLPWEPDLFTAPIFFLILTVQRASGPAGSAPGLCVSLLLPLVWLTPR